MSKRAGGDHLSREQFEDGRPEEREFAPVDISEQATDSVMSQRKVFVPKSRLPGGQTGKPFTFGASTAANALAPSQSTNVFGGFKSNVAPVNPFQSLATNAPSKPANQPALGAINTDTNNTTSREFLHFKALNNKFLRKLEDFSKSAENGSDWSHLCEMYLDFAKRARARARDEENQGQGASTTITEQSSFRIPSTQAPAQSSHLNSSGPVNPPAKEGSGNDADIVDVSIADESADNSSKMTDSPQVSKVPKPTTAPTGFKFDGIPEGPPSFVFGGKTVQPKALGHKASASVGGFVYQPGGAGKLMLDNDSSEKATEKSNLPVPEVKSANTSLANGPAFSFGANDPSPVKQGTGSLNFTFSKPAETTAVKSEQPDLRPSGPPQPAGFKFGQQEQQPGTQAPIAKPAAAPKKIPEFSFGQPAATTRGASATAFTFGASAATPKTESSAPSDDKKPAFSFSTNSAAPAPTPKPAGAGFVFGASASSQPAAASSGFAFGSNSTETKKPEEKPQPKPFTFGSSAPAPAPAGAPSQAPKPAFTFGSGLESAKSAEKPAFSFGSTTNSAKPVATETATTKPAFTFGSTSAGTGSAFGGSGFSFGKKTDEVSQAMPKFGFQSDSKADAPKFTFGDSAAGAANSSLFPAKPALEAKDDDEDAEAQADPQIDDLTQQGPGEENEEAVYEKRAKVLELKDGAFETLGVGSLRVLVDKDSKKSRVIIRADGSGRVVINVALRSALSYTVEQKNCVRALDFGSGGEKPRVYFLRVKTGEDAEALAKELERVKS